MPASETPDTDAAYERPEDDVVVELDGERCSGLGRQTARGVGVTVVGGAAATVLSYRRPTTAGRLVALLTELKREGAVMMAMTSCVCGVFLSGRAVRRRSVEGMAASCSSDFQQADSAPICVRGCQIGGLNLFPGSSSSF